MKIEKFNTNNAWGFGGSVGTVTKYANGFSHEKGKRCFRHAKPESYNRYRDGDGKEITKKEFDAAIDAEKSKTMKAIVGINVPRETR